MSGEQPTPAPTTDGSKSGKPTVDHAETMPEQPGKVKNGDTALALFDNFDDLHEEIDPVENKRLVRKIDFMILPYLAVCYAFYYVSVLLSSGWAGSDCGRLTKRRCRMRPFSVSMRT